MVNNVSFIKKKKNKVSLDGVVYIDTSGSISDESLKAILDKISSLINQTNGKLILKMFDTMVYDLGVYTKDKLKNKITAIGRGGTEIQPVIKDIKCNKYNEKHNTVLMLYSDLYYGYVKEEDINMFDIVMIDNEKSVNIYELNKIKKSKIVEIKP
jgi:predicted metal-dependent peptidase